LSLSCFFFFNPICTANSVYTCLGVCLFSPGLGATLLKQGGVPSPSAQVCDWQRTTEQDAGNLQTACVKHSWHDQCSSPQTQGKGIVHPGPPPYRGDAVGLLGLSVHVVSALGVVLGGNSVRLLPLT
jgi:hypothetical protein